MALALLDAFVWWIDLAGGCLWKGNLEKHGGICLMVAFRYKFQKYFSVLFRDHLNIFRANWEEGVFGHYKEVPRGPWVDFENKGFNLVCFDFNDGLVEFDPVVEALTPQAHFFPLPWLVAYFHLCLLLCCDISVFPTEVALLTQRKVGYRGKIITNFTEALLFLFIVVQIANISLPPQKNGGIVLNRDCCG